MENNIDMELNLEVDQMEEEESVTLPFMVAKSSEWQAKEVLFVVAKAKGHNLDLCGKTLLDWVLLAGGACEKQVIDMPENELSALKAINTDKPYIALFYSDTPLMDKATFHKIMDYFCVRNYNVLTLPRGIVVKSEFLKNAEQIMSAASYSESVVRFQRVDDSHSLARVSEELFERIRQFHLDNGVVMYGANSIFIDADVEIEEGAVIYPNNILRGQTYVGRNVLLEPNNVISDSIISDDACVTSSVIEKSKVSKGVNVGPFEHLIGSER